MAKSGAKGIKRDDKGRFAKGNVPPLKGRKMPLWWKLKDSEGKKKIYLENPELAKQHSSFMKGYYKNPANREKTRKAVLNFLERNKNFGKKLSAKLIRYNKEHPETARMHRIFMKKYFTAEKRRQDSIALKRYYKNHPETRLRLSGIKKEYYNKHPGIKLLIGKNTSQFFANPLNRKLASARMNERYKNHPYLKKEISDAKQLYYEKHPVALKRLLEYGKKALKRHLKTRQGFLVRSFGEKRIADFLFEKKKPAMYEAIELNLPEIDPVPDFYLKWFNVFVEYYGGYYKAWKSKVEKNRLYKKYKILVIFITPAELSNLDYYLLKDAERISKTGLCRNFNVSEWALNKEGLTERETRNRQEKV